MGDYGSAYERVAGSDDRLRDGEDGWIVASIPEIKGVHSQGRTREEARANVIDALRLRLSPESAGADDAREREQLHLTIAA